MPALMRSELPELARTRHHWIVLLRPPGRWGAIAFGLLLVWSFLAPAMFIVVVLLLGAIGFLRWQTWRAELIILTQRRIVRVRGVPETTTTEASLRIDRVSGARLIQTVPGKLLGYGTIELEAPGDHPDVRKLVKIADPTWFYGKLRTIVFTDHSGPDPDDVPSGDSPTGYLPKHDSGNDYVTERLPRYPR